MKEEILTIRYSDDVLLSLKESKEEFEREARYLLALKLYELGKMSSGKAAKIAGISRVAFLMRMGMYKVSPFQVDLEEILEEARSDG
jgi:predicted HTH domain antitoxin